MQTLARKTTKTKEIILAFKKHRMDAANLRINGGCIERVQTFKFPTTVVSADLVWTANTTAKAQQRLHFLRVARRDILKDELPTIFCCFYPLESLPTYGITVWYASCADTDRKRLRRISNTAQRIIGCPLLSRL